MTDLKQKILTAVVDDLQSIEAALAVHLNPHFKLVEQVAGHILFAGGKRLRPLLMVLAARACGHLGDHLSKYAVIFEYLHAATLLHDDVVDGGELRRGSQAASRRPRFLARRKRGGDSRNDQIRGREIIARS